MSTPGDDNWEWIAVSSKQSTLSDLLFHIEESLLDVNVIGSVRSTSVSLDSLSANNGGAAEANGTEVDWAASEGRQLEGEVMENDAEKVMEEGVA